MIRIPIGVLLTLILGNLIGLQTLAPSPRC